MLILSMVKDGEKTVRSLRVAWKFFCSMALLVLLTIWAIGFLLSFISPELVSRIIGQDSGFKGVILAGLFGSVVLIQAFIAFPLAGSFLRKDASVTAIAAFVTTLVMVGVLTAPLRGEVSRCGIRRAAAGFNPAQHRSHQLFSQRYYEKEKSS